MLNNTMTYKGYVARVEFDPRDEIFFGEVLGTDDIIGFHGSTVTELTEDFHAAIENYLADCALTGREVQKPAVSGAVMLPVPFEILAAAEPVAHAAGKEVSEWAADVLAKALQAQMAPAPSEA